MDSMLRNYKEINDLPPPLFHPFTNYATTCVNNVLNRFPDNLCII